MLEPSQGNINDLYFQYLVDAKLEPGQLPDNLMHFDTSSDALINFYSTSILDTNKSYPNPNDPLSETQCMSGAPIVCRVDPNTQLMAWTYIRSIYNGYYHKDAQEFYKKATGHNFSLMFGPCLNYGLNFKNLFLYASGAEDSLKRLSQ